MNRTSPRLVLGAITLLVIAVSLLLLVLGRGGQPPKPYTPQDIAAGEVPPGSEVVLAGVVVTQGARSIVLRPEDAPSPMVTVDLSAKSARVSFGSGSHVAVRGVTTAEGTIVGASVIAPSPPSKYQSATTTP